MIKKITDVKGIKDAYSRRILSNLIGQDPMRVFARTSADLRKLTRGLTLQQLHASPGRRRWSIAQIVAHLCDAEWAVGYRVRKVIAEPKSPLLAYDQDKWAAHLHYDEMDFSEKLELFAALRSSHLALLKLLSPTELRRYGIHSERGKETVERMIHMLAGHDVNHLKQIESLRRSFTRKKN